MAGRPGKIGLDYFELDCHMDDKIKLIEAEFGLKGFAIVVKLYQGIYSGFGYYCEWTPDISLLWAMRLGVSHGGGIGKPGNADAGASSLSGFPDNLINNVVAASIKRGIFSKDLFSRYHILTSSGIQKRYLNATSKRERVEMKKEYLLISVGENPVNVVINSISDGENSFSGVRNTHSKENESKGEYIADPKGSARQTDVRRIVEKWNTLKEYGIKPVIKVGSGSKRYNCLCARIREYGVDDVIRAIDQIKTSDFLQGKGKKGWVITFDWFVLPSNFPKVLEGNYDRESKPQGTGKNQFNNYQQGTSRQTVSELESLFMQETNGGQT